MLSEAKSRFLSGKKLIFVFLLLIINYSLLITTYSFSQFVIQRVKLEPNNISAYFQNTGIFDQNTTSGSAPGFEWPKGSTHTACFTAGPTIAAMVNDTLRMAAASYTGEYAPGYCINGVPFTNSNFKIYKVSRGDNQYTNPDWLNWGLMVPYGAPFVDVNNNGTYEPAIDTPGVKNAASTIFLCMTDGFTYSHNPLEGFGGGTSPLFAEVHLTAWAYTQYFYADMQFLKFVIINKGMQPWTRTYFSLVTDPDIGWDNDDYMGCDTARKLGYSYNGTNNDPVYGTAPPAVGFLLLKGSYNRYSNPPKQLDMTSFVYFVDPQPSPPPCEVQPIGDPNGAYHFMQGYKRDSTCWLDPTQLIYPPNFYKKIKFVWPGDPETSNGWTSSQLNIGNCGLDSSGNPLVQNQERNRRFVLSSGAENLSVMPGDTQTIIISQLIERGSTNKNSVTKLKQSADGARQFYNSGFTIGINKISSEVPTAFRLEQNYPNPFNPTTKIRFDLPLRRGVGGMTTLIIYDITGREIQTLVKEKLNPGTYEVTFDGSYFASGVYFYQLKNGEYVETKKLVLLK